MGLRCLSILTILKMRLQSYLLYPHFSYPPLISSKNASPLNSAVLQFMTPLSTIIYSWELAKRILSPHLKHAYYSKSNFFNLSYSILNFK